MWHKIVNVFLISIFLKKVYGFPETDPVVDTKVGIIRGLRATDGNYSMFLGIPYAKVNQSNPFGHSSPYPKFETEYEAFDDSAICPQAGFPGTTLDCLRLNVYVPDSASTRSRLPVMVWIYGGGFQYGLASRRLYGPKFLVKHDVVMVALNYRIGPYGFMCLDIPEVPGNQGLKDQLIALRWIKNNIEAFGGDHSKITIFGESAGGASVDFHLYYTEEKLFHKAILQSGFALSPWAVTEANTTAILSISRQLEFDTNNTREALSFLSIADQERVIEATYQLGFVFFCPVVEKEFSNVDRFITDYPINMDLPKVKNIPILLGINHDEWLFEWANADSYYIKTKNAFYKEIKKNFRFEEVELDEMASLVRYFYIGDNELSDTNYVKWGLIDFYSDILMNHPAERTIKKSDENGASSIFHYVFSYNGGRNFVKQLYNVTIGSAAHGDEFWYLFDVEGATNIQPDDQLIIDRMSKLWTNFAKYSDPTPETTDLLPVKWEPVTKDSMFFLNIDLELELGSRPFNVRMAFWDVFYKLNQKSIPGYRPKRFDASKHQVLKN